MPCLTGTQQREVLILVTVSEEVNESLCAGPAARWESVRCIVSSSFADDDKHYQPSQMGCRTSGEEFCSRKTAVAITVKL